MALRMLAGVIALAMYSTLAAVFGLTLGIGPFWKLFAIATALALSLIAIIALGHYALRPL